MNCSSSDKNFADPGVFGRKKKATIATTIVIEPSMKKIHGYNIDQLQGLSYDRLLILTHPSYPWNEIWLSPLASNPPNAPDSGAAQ